MTDTSIVTDPAQALTLCIDTRLYTEEVVFRTCYLFTDRCYLLLEEGGTDRILVHVRGKDANVDVDAVRGEFANELINQRVRQDLARETQGVRELIVRQAFGEADLAPS